MNQNELLHNFLSFFFFVFGGLLGSFSNVVVLRMSQGTSVIFPPSSCPKCKHQLHAADLIPVLSWLFLRGKCRYCSANISKQYPVVEFAMACIIGLSFFKTGLNYEFISLAGKSAIWLVATVIFVRREVLKSGPYLWPALFFFLLSLPANSCPFILWPIKLIPVAAILAGVIASCKIRYETIFAWVGLSFLFLFSTVPLFSFWPFIIILVFALAAAFTKKFIYVEKLFAALNILTIYFLIWLK
ncbi:MAG: prepilin peptidase [Candidatus Rifleibacteriota bacterium]